PNGRRVGIRMVTCEACSGFTRVTARRIAQPPKPTCVTRLQSLRLPARAARQLPDQSTTLRVESSSTGNPRLRGALPTADIERGRREGFALEGRSINTDRAGGPTPSRGLAVKATCGEAGATPLVSRLEGVGGRSRRHCQRSRAFGCSAYRQSGTAEIDRRRPKMQPTFFVEHEGGFGLSGD